MPPKSKKPQGSTSPALASRLPRSWPSGTTYLHKPCYSKQLTHDSLNALICPRSNLPDNEQARVSNGPYSNVKIMSIVSPSHPANGQCGLFSTQKLEPDSFILSYLGFVHGKNETDETSDYDLSLDRELGVGIDASTMGNEARFINDYRGVSSSANAEFRDVFVNIGSGKVEKRVGVFVLSAGKSGKRAKGIEKGHEILVSYGKGFWMERKQSQE
ncbi:hypothetical protein P154DRAFT_453059, partial [Amniculicola lignicola CBS 123094]